MHFLFRSERQKDIEQHVQALTNIAFGEKVPNTQTTTGGEHDPDNSIAIQLKAIRDELKPYDVHIYLNCIVCLCSISL